MGSLIPGIVSGDISNPNSFFQGSEIRTLLVGIYGLISAVEVILLFAYYRVKSSLVLLASEVSQPRLATAGWLLLLATILGLVTLIWSFASLYTGTTSYESLATSASSEAYLVSLPGLVILIVGTYFGYGATKNALGSS